MKSVYHTLALLAVLYYSSCVFPNEREKEREKRRQAKLEHYIEESETVEISKLDTTDYSNIVMSNDSLDIKLYELITDNGSFSEEMLLKNIETLIQRGAKPNALVETTYIVRKTGTYIPIIKHFYKNKYREYTKITTCMHAAVESGNIKIVKKLMEHGGNINLINPSNSYPLHIALLTDNEAMVDFLIKSGADIKKIKLSNSQNISLIEKLVKQGADPKTIDINFALNDTRELKRLLVLKPKIDNSQLDFSIVMQNDELLALLMDYGMTPKAIGKFPDECPAIFAAIKYDNFNAFKKLHSAGGSLTETCKHGFGDTPLQSAIHYQRIDVINFLLANKVSANEKDWTKKSALMMACNTDNDQIINILLDAGAQLEYTGYFNKTPLMQAVEYDKYISAECLLKRKANVNHRKSNGLTPLLAAIKKNNYPMIKLLVEYGANTKVYYENLNIVEFAEQENAAPAVISYLKGLDK